MLEDRFLKRLRKKARKGLRGWPMATIALFYGPDRSSGRGARTLTPLILVRIALGSSVYCGKTVGYRQATKRQRIALFRRPRAGAVSREGSPNRW